MSFENENKYYGWIRDLPDHRDHLYAAPVVTLNALPDRVDLRNLFPPVYNQGNLGSCTANGIAAVLQFERFKQGLTPDFIPSRLFIYYNERVMENTVNSDSGASIRSGIKSVAQQGDCPESRWPYDITQFKVRPPQQCYDEALRYQVLSYSSVVQDINQMKGCLASGHPFVFGFMVYSGFNSRETAQSGRVPMPNYSERPSGAHCVVAVGYDDSQQRFLIRNSRGSGWGMQGYCTMPYGYLATSSFASDFWTIRTVRSLAA